MSNPGIASLVKSQGWKDIVEIFNKEMDVNLKNIATDQTAEEIAIQFTGKLEAQKIIHKVFREIDRQAGYNEPKEKQSFK